MGDFNLRHLVRDVLDSTDEADPGAIAEMVLARIPADATGAALGQVMRLFVRNVISETRNGRDARNEPHQSVTPLNRSVKVAAIRDGWQRRLNDRLHVGGGAWKQLRACTYEDLCAAASERRDLAERNHAWARQYEAWARLVSQHGVATFGELPAEAQLQALGRAA